MSVPGGFFAATLKLSPDRMALLKSVEELYLKPYDDQTGEVITQWVQGATIGYGHLIAQTEWANYGDGISEPAADTRLAADLAPFQRAVRSAITVGLQQHEFDALVIFAFNIGERAFRSSSVVRLINEPEAIASKLRLESAWKAWNKSQGKVMKGLDNRRRCEWQVFTRAVYERW